MPSASPMYTFSSGLTEPETPVALPKNGNVMTTVSTLLEDSANDNGGHIFCMDIKNDNFASVISHTSCGSPNESSFVYHPFKCLNAMAEQGLNGRFSSAVPKIVEIDICGSGSGCKDAARASSNISHMYTINSHDRSSTHFNNFDQLRQYRSCDRTMYSMSSSSSLSSSSSPPLSPASSCCMFRPTSDSGISIGEALTNDSSKFHKISPPANQTQISNFIKTDNLFSRTSPTNQNSLREVKDVRSFCKKGYPSCSSDSTLEEDDRLLSWTMQYPENWRNSEVLDWIFYVAQERGLDMQEFRGENFQGVTGDHLCQMGPEDFIRLEPKFGRVIYEMFRKLVSGVVFRKPQDQDTVTSDSILSNPFSTTSLPKTSLAIPSYHSAPSSFQASAGTEMSNCNGMETNTFFKQERYSSMENDNIDIASYDFDVDDTLCLTASQCQDQFQPEYAIQYPQTTSVPTSCCFPGSSFPSQLPRRRPGRPRVKGLVVDDRASTEKKGKTQHLWEFIYETLMNPVYNPQFLRWENQREGVFRFVQSEAVAQLWGGRKNNENMTYEKLSRAMRHYYRRGILERVEGRRLVYKFSLKAMDRVRERRGAV